jgi:photosystem II stability/assembly factor-like uncharacterized protein
LIRIVLTFCLLAVISVSAADLPTQFLLPDDRLAGSISSDAPLPGLVTNTAIDIVEHDGAVWLATGRGAMFTDDGGLTWQYYDVANGLVSDNLSAIFSAVSNRLWIGSNHDELINDQLFSLSDGLSYTDDNGSLWTQVDFSSSGQDIENVWGGNRQVFDIAGLRDGGNRDWSMFSAFAAGLLASQDNGESWRRIYASPADSAQFNTVGAVPSFRNRYFSCVADTSHDDTVTFWTGTAAGVFQYIYAEPEDKFYLSRVNAVAVCDTCSDDTSFKLFAGGDFGLSRARLYSGPFQTSFESAGLPEPWVSAASVFGGRLFLGLLDTVTETSSLFYSDDLGETFTDITLAVGQDTVTDFAALGDRFYAAAGVTGLWVTTDTGLNWNRILVDSADAPSAFNAVNDIDVAADTIRLGTDTGYVSLTLTPAGTIDSVFTHTFPENLRESRKVTKIAAQYRTSEKVLWALTVPATPVGTHSIQRSLDGGELWNEFGVDSVWHDLAFLNDTGYFVGEEGLFFNLDAQGVMAGQVSIENSLFSLDNDTGFVVEVVDNQLVFGTNGRLAISFNADDNTRGYYIFGINTDTLRADAVVNFNFLNTLIPDTAGARVGLTGDFIPAMGVQYFDDEPDTRARVWASGRPVSGGGNGISMGRYVEEVDDLDDTTTVLRWLGLYFDDFAWNYAFNGDTVFAATSSGLLYKDMGQADSLENVWDTLDFADAVGNVLIEAGVPTFGVRTIGNDLWVGTGDGTVKINLADFADQNLFLVVDSSTPPDEVYAFPVPFRPNIGDRVDFHFTVQRDANVTIDIYDFAMNLVATPIDNVFYPAGIYHGTSPSGGSAGNTWDGFNDRGDIAAVGMYYFKVSYSTGEERWGKIAVIP